MGTVNEPSGVQVSPPPPDPRDRPFPVRGLAGVVVDLLVQESGPSEGPLVVFFNGMVGKNLHWDPVVAALEAHARCVRVAVPYFRLQGDDCSVQGGLCLVRSFLDQRGLVTGASPAVLIGPSIGGQLAVHLSIDPKRTVKGLVLIGSAGVRERAFDGSGVSKIRRNKEWVRELFSGLFHDPAKHMREDELEEAFRELSKRSGTRAMMAISRSSREDHLGDLLHRVRIPTLLVWGRHDQVTPPEAAEEFARGIAGSRLVWLERSGHAPLAEQPAELAAAIRGFVHDLWRG